MKDEPHGVPLDFTRNKPSEPLPDISALLIRTQEGNPKALLANAITILRYHPQWRMFSRSTSFHFMWRPRSPLPGKNRPAAIGMARTLYANAQNRLP